MLMISSLLAMELINPFHNNKSRFNTTLQEYKIIDWLNNHTETAITYQHFVNRGEFYKENYDL